MMAKEGFFKFRFLRRLYGPISRTIDKTVMFQREAVKKADRISKGEKVPAPIYEAEERVLRELSKDSRIKEEINRKNEDLIGNVNKITITSKDPIEPETSKRELPKRPWEYEHDNKQDYEYGFFEPPLEKLEKNRLMLREALEILRARMEKELHPNENQKNEELNNMLNAHPAAKRVDQEKLETMWKYFRPFAERRQQKIVMKQDLDTFSSFIEGGDKKRDPRYKQIMNRLRAVKQSLPELEELEHLEQQDETGQTINFRKELEEKHEKEMKRLEERLKEFRMMEEEESKSNDKNKK